MSYWLIDYQIFTANGHNLISLILSPALSDVVRNVIGYDQATRTLYGLARDSTGPYYIRSADNGLTWVAVSETEWTAASDRVTSTDFPLESQDGFSYGIFNSYVGTDFSYVHTGEFTNKIILILGGHGLDNLKT